MANLEGIWSREEEHSSISYTFKDNTYTEINKEPEKEIIITGTFFATDDTIFFVPKDGNCLNWLYEIMFNKEMPETLNISEWLPEYAMKYNINNNELTMKNIDDNTYFNGLFIKQTD